MQTCTQLCFLDFYLYVGHSTGFNTSENVIVLCFLTLKKFRLKVVPSVQTQRQPQLSLACTLTPTVACIRVTVEGVCYLHHPAVFPCKC